ncbi:MAG: hypothetical protein PW735_11195 [Acidobacteriaceae bacterium]|nr:hypothetical protein [Acidobacteriaceae bacterium]
MLISDDQMRRAVSQGEQRSQLGLLRISVLLLLFCMASVASSQTLEILLINGKNGRPMVGESSHVNVWVGTERTNAILVPTDKKGIARIQLTLDPTAENIPKPGKYASIFVEHPILKYDGRLSINVPYAVCASGGSNYSWLGIMNFSTSEILEHGKSSPNTCGKATVQPKPGQLILFVRHLSWWEEFKS